MTVKYRNIVLVVVVVQALACRARTELSSVERRFDTLSRKDQAASQLPDPARAAVVGTAYDEAFSSQHENQSLVHVRDRELDLLFRAARMAAFYTLDLRHIGHMRSALEE